MGRRSGSVDSGLLLDLLRRRDVAVDELKAALVERAGLLGVSGVCADLRAVLASADAGHGRAELARPLLVHRVIGEVGSVVATLGGLDALVLTTGIGEHSARDDLAVPAEVRRLLGPAALRASGSA